VTLLLSGGGDSVALFHLLREAEQPFRALHFVHDGLPEFAIKGRRFCEELCDAHGVPLEVEQIHGRPLTQQGDLSWEAACRHLRYQSLSGKRGPFLTAHTTDDQAETLVMRLLGGSGLAGLGGIHPVREDGVIRPLLGFERSELRDYLRQKQARWLDDPTNEDGNQRAIVRNQILPVLLEQNPGLLSTLTRTASRLRQDESFLSRAAQAWMREHGTPEGDSWPLLEVQQLPPALLARFFRALSKAVSEPAHRPRATLIEECIKLAKNGTNEAHVPFPGGWSIRILGARLWVCPALPPEQWSSEPEQASEVCSGLKVSSEPREGWEAWHAPEGSVLRSRRPGDRFMGKSLKKVLANTGHPPWVRSRWPLLVKGDQVLAVFGMKVSDSLRAEPNIWLRFQPEVLRVRVNKLEK
jgi:tRNA(Ile)-lysidine synthase